MKKIALALAVTAPFAVQAETIEIEKPEFYGKLNLTQEFVQQQDAGNFSQLNSNASRLGLKGNVALENGLSVIYQAEVEVFADNGSKTLSGKVDNAEEDKFNYKSTLTQRNTFAGVKGGFGTVQFGVFDTPFKLSQGKVDLFNDLQGDIKNVISASGENRKENSVQYTSPSLAGVVVAVDHINSEDEETNNGVSASLAYTLNGLYLAYAYDTDVKAEGTDLGRVVAQYTLGAVQLGALWETQDVDGTDSVDGWMASAAYKLNGDVTLKAQYGASDIKKEGGVSYSLGADYKLAKTAKTFAYVTSEESDDESLNAQYYGLGLEVSF
ncbi:porin [Thalassolituus sp. LLYu03]|uniref:porin n=1 Tax=Thalassolituus sp. LLYu03 TaxID=3421656 RepID=UPI003D2BD934